MFCEGIKFTEISIISEEITFGINDIICQFVHGDGAFLPQFEELRWNSLLSPIAAAESKLLFPYSCCNAHISVSNNDKI